MKTHHRLIPSTCLLLLLHAGFSEEVGAQTSEPPIVQNLAKAAREAYTGRARLISQSPPLNSDEQDYIVFSHDGKRVLLYSPLRHRKGHAETGVQ